MAEAIKFTDEELKNIETLQKKYSELTFRFGQLYLEKMDIQSRVTQNSLACETAEKELSEVKEKGSSLATTLQQKYGDGQLNLETGIFTPAADEQKITNS